MDLDAVFEEWRERLGLSGWTIKWSLEGHSVLGRRHGNVQVWPLKRAARIRLLDPDLPFIYVESEVDPYDLEVALVHELLHCVLWTFRGKPGSVEDLVQEQAIHDLSRLLVSQQRSLRSSSQKRGAKRGRVLEFPVAS